MGKGAPTNVATLADSAEAEEMEVSLHFEALPACKACVRVSMTVVVSLYQYMAVPHVLFVQTELYRVSMVLRLQQLSAPYVLGGCNEPEARAWPDMARKAVPKRMG